MAEVRKDGDKEIKVLDDVSLEMQQGRLLSAQIITFLCSLGRIIAIFSLPASKIGRFLDSRQLLRC